MKKEESEMVRNLARGFAVGYEAHRQGMTNKAVVQAFHGLCLELMPNLKYDEKTREQVVGALMRKQRELRDGHLT